MKKNKILVSAGWGYKNLGDDAILVSTISLVRDACPGAQIIVSSYNPADTRAITKGLDVQIVSSVYFYLFGAIDRFRYYDDQIGNSNSLLSKLKRYLVKKRGRYLARAWMRLAKSNEPGFMRLVSKLYPDVADQFKGIDLFIMAGGGYFTSWQESVLSRSVEINLAKKNQAKLALVGQSIGPFVDKLTRTTAVRCLSKSDKILVRDKDSFLELTDLGVNVDPVIIPDLALSDTFVYEKKNQLVFIVFYDKISERIAELRSALSRFANDNGLDIVVSVSQLWNGTIDNAKRLYESLIELPNSFQVRFVVPRDMNELQTLVGQSKIVVSQNLHGLIMSYRAGSPIVCLNDKRKFVAFMDLIGMSDLLIAMENVDSETLYVAMKRALDSASNIESSRHDIRIRTISEFRQSLGIEDHIEAGRLDNGNF